MRRFTVLFVLVLASSFSLFGQTLAERLGYPPATTPIIVHADDLGETHAVNAAALRPFQSFDCR